MRKTCLSILIPLAILCGLGTKIITNAVSADLLTIVNTNSSAIYTHFQTNVMPVLPEYIRCYVCTPNGTSVQVIRYIEDFSDDAINDLQANYSKEAPYKDAVLLEPPTRLYNCHSYAWYSQDTSTNTYWMSDPSQYYTDSSYYEVSTPRAGDIICYFDDMGTATTSDDVNLHSGIVTSVNSSQVNDVCGKASLVNVTSKWGMEGLFYHRGDICPYVSTYSTGRADYVKFYRPRTQATYSLSSTMSSLSLTRTVSGSGAIIDTYGMYELNIMEAGRYTFTICSDKALDNRLYDVHMNQIQLTSLTSGTGTYTYDQYLSAGIYYLRTAYADTTNSGTINITLAAHSHNYDRWVYYNRTTHVESCRCGQTGSARSAHCVRASDIVNNRANCLGCGYLLDFDSDVAQITPERIAKMSVNGSYILSDGVVVLADEDMDAYLNGTLLFYDIDDLPETE